MMLKISNSTKRWDLLYELVQNAVKITILKSDKMVWFICTNGVKY